jgi:hypothetical protein
MKNVLLALAVLLSTASCTRRVYWPQGHYRRAAVPVRPLPPTQTLGYAQFTTSC